jgi:2-polyprenyl-3-methyl-5-hydroxy-6-metoxy-1,4-benzoquinol methylase
MDKYNLIPQYYFMYSAVATIVEQAFADKEIVTILEAGCGKGEFCLALSELLTENFPSIKFRIQGFDINERPEHHEIDSSLVNLISENDNWPYTNNSFDIVMSNQVIEHVKNADFFLKELTRVMSIGGYSIHSYPVKEIIIEPHYFLPLVHWLDNWDFRRFIIKFFSKFGLGTFKKQLQNGLTEDLEKWANMHSDYTTNFTHYLNLNDYLLIAKRYGLRASCRFTHEYSVYRLLEKLGMNVKPQLNLAKEFSFINDYFLIHFYKRIVPIILFLHKQNEM